MYRKITKESHFRNKAINHRLTHSPLFQLVEDFQLQKYYWYHKPVNGWDFSSMSWWNWNEEPNEEIYITDKK